MVCAVNKNQGGAASPPKSGCWVDLVGVLVRTFVAWSSSSENSVSILAELINRLLQTSDINGVLPFAWTAGMNEACHVALVNAELWCCRCRLGQIVTCLLGSVRG
jgi:hypothetical protein